MLNKNSFVFTILLITAFISLAKIPIATAGIDKAFDSSADSNLDKAGYEMGYSILGYHDTVDNIISTIIEISLSFLGVIFMIILIYGGYLWMTSRGNEQQYEKSKNLIRAAIIGLFIVASAYAITWYITSTLGQGTLNN